jgi:hypothetical protein
MTTNTDSALRELMEKHAIEWVDVPLVSEKDLTDNAEAFARALIALCPDLVIVPREPTVTQATAGVDADDLRTGFETAKHIYRAMLAATQPTAQEK